VTVALLLRVIGVSSSQNSGSHGIYLSGFFDAGTAPSHPGKSVKMFAATKVF
jgi:hypothetical protein